MIDSHCHLADDVFADDATATIARARAEGVAGALCILDAGSAVERDRAGALRLEWDGLSFATGVHPHQAGTWAGRTVEAMACVAEAIRATPAVRAVGEIGLDYHYDFSPRDVQRDLFAAQVELAADRDLPIVIHAREADDDALAVVREAGQGRVRGVMHCFTGTMEFARRALDMGLHISVAGIVTFPKATQVHEVARLVPEDRLLVETDSPFLAPVPHRGRRNEPAWVVHVGSRVAHLRGVATATLDAQTTRNFDALFQPLREIAERR
jgi:TatD DNase family protein